MILGTVVEADNRGRTDGITDKGSREYHTDIHDGPIGRYPVFAGIMHKLRIIDHSDDAHRNITHKFRRTVGTSLN